MGASESTILYQKDIADLFPAGEINIANSCEIVKCTPTPKNTIEDFTNTNKNNITDKYLLIFILLFLFLLIFLLIFLFNK